MLSLRSSCTTICLATVATLLFANQVAAAQSYPVPPPPPPPAPSAAPGAAPVTPAVATASVRRGLTLGGGIGVGGIADEDGRIECIDCESSTAGSLGLHAGWMINPHLAVGVDVWGAVQALDADGNTALVQVLTTAGAQYWLNPRWWVKAGVGTARLSESDSAADENTEVGKGAAIMAAVGFEAWHHGRFVLDLELRAAKASYEELDQSYTQGALQVGVSWY